MRKLNEMNKRKPFCCIILGLIVLLVLICVSDLGDDTTHIDYRFKVETFDRQTYEHECIQLYERLRNPSPSLYFNPPIKRPPSDMYDRFTQNGLMPIKKWWYINDLYSDSKGDARAIKDVSMDDFNYWRKRVRKNKRLHYHDKTLNDLMHIFDHEIVNKSITVIGTVQPWIEAIAYELNASEITTLDFTRKRYGISKMNWLHVNDYYDHAIRNNQLEHFDNAVSFSSIEHTGLGRYGDPLSPDGDIEAVRQVHCMLKPGGLFFLGLPTTKDGSSHIEFNAHRMYGLARLQVLFRGWKLVAKKISTPQDHTVFVLQKIV